MRIGSIIIAATLVVSGTVGFAVETTTAPAATQAATRPVASWASPKEAYLTFTRAYVAKDGLTLSKSVAWDDPSDDARIKLLKPPSETWNLELYQLLAQQFPEDKTIATLLTSLTAAAKKEKTNAATVVAKTEELLDKANVVINGDTASINMRPIINGDLLESINLKKVEGTWRVLPEVIGMPYAPEDAETRAELEKSVKMQVRSAELNRESQQAFMKDLRAKKFATAKEALAALQQANTDALNKLAAEINPPK